MFPQHPAQSAEMLRRILIESNLKQENTADRTEQVMLDGQQVENVDGPTDDVSVAGRIGVSGYSWDNVIADRMLSELALSPHGLEEDVTDEADQSEMLGLNIDNDSSGNCLLS